MFQLRHWEKDARELRTKGLMRDLYRCELGQEAIGPLSFLWGSARVKNDVGVRFEVGL